MNEPRVMNILYRLLIALPTMLAAPLNVYFISDVLRYEIKRKKIAYILSVILGGFGITISTISIPQCSQEDGELSPLLT